MEMEREYEDWMNGIQKIQNYIYACTISKVQSLSLSKVQSLSMSSQSLLILWGDFIMSHPKVMILCTVHSLSESLCVISFNSM